MSLSLCILSLEQSDNNLRSASISIYQQSLPRLRKAISKLSQSHSESLRKAVVAACFVCAHAEYMMDSPNNADCHLEGIETIIKHGGAEALEDEGLRRLLYNHRGIWLTRSFVLNNVPIYSQTVWQELLDGYKDEATQNIFQKLSRTAAHSPPLLQEFYRRQDNLEQAQLQQLLSKLQRQIDAYQQWRQDIDFPELDSRPEDLGNIEPNQEAWLRRLEEKGLDTITSLHCFSGYMIHLYLLQRAVLGKIKGSPKSSRLENKEIIRAITHHCDMIVKIGPLCLNVRYGLEGTPYLPFSIDACWRGLEATDQITPDMLSFFQKTAVRMRERGFQTLTQPWLDQQCSEGKTQQPVK